MKAYLDLLVLFGIVVLTRPVPAGSQDDPVIVDPLHYNVEQENDRVRILRIKYGPRERGAMHRHPDAVVVFLTDARQAFSFPDGTTRERSKKARDVVWLEAQTHRAENMTDEPLELIAIELK